MLSNDESHGAKPRGYARKLFDPYGSTRGDILTELADMPRNAMVSSRLAAIYLDTSPAVLAAWRMHRRGPRYVGNGRLLRYRICDLDAYMDVRGGEVVGDELLKQGEDHAPRLGGREALFTEDA
jgi:hypothetical protein